LLGNAAAQSNHGEYNIHTGEKIVTGFIE